MSSWNVEMHRGAASAFHARAVPEPAGRHVWVHEVERAALVLGSSQRDDVVDRDAVKRAGVEVVRRGSGGGAVLLVPGEVLWVDVVIGTDDPLWCDDVGASMTWLGEVWAAAVGADAAVHRGAMTGDRWSALACFAGLGRGEVTRRGRKLVGVSQRRTRASARFQCALYRRFDAAVLPALLALDGADRRQLSDVLGARVEVVTGFDVDRFLTTLSART